MAFFQKVLKIQEKNLNYKISELDRFLELRDKNLVFIGTIGVGKTTSICSLFDLFDKKKRPILKTGAGATTICEVEIVFGNDYQIRIDEYCTDEMVQLINDFTDTKIGATQNVDGQQQSLSTEMERAIKFVIAPDGMRLIDIDPYIDNVINQNNNQKKQVLDVFLCNANLELRTKTEFYCPSNEEDPMSWVREAFSKLNDGKNILANIPKKIYITLNNEIKYNNKIIDTKGIDSIATSYLREDLDRYIKNPDNLIIYCSSFTAAPDTNIFESIKFYSKKDQEISRRMLLLIIPKFDEPVHVSGVDHYSEENPYKQGLDLRYASVKQQLFAVLNSDGFILNHNFMAGDSDVYNNSINDIIGFQNKLIEESFYNKKNLSFQLKNIHENILTPQQLQIQNDISINLDNLSRKLLSFSFNTAGFISHFVNQYAIKYPAANTKNAIHVRYGIYLNKNLYFDFEVQVEALIDEFILQNNILSILQYYLGINQQIMEDIVPSIYEDFQNRFRELTTIVTDEMRTYFSQKASNYDFWQPMIRRWGGGPGYNIDVKQSLKNQMDLISIERKFNQKIQEHWDKLVDSFIGDLK